MKQSLLLLIVLVLLSSLSLVTPIDAPNKSHRSQTPVGAPAPGPSGSDCSSVIFSMMDCITYLTVGSNETKPKKSCCDGINTVLEYNPKCICESLVTASQMGVELNNTRALQTPKDCKLPISPPHCAMTPSATTPGASPVSASPSAGTPKTSPSAAKSPETSPSAAKSPETSPSSDETSSKTAPSPSSSGTNILSVPALTIVASIAYFWAFSN